MAYRLQKDEPLAAGFERIAEEQIDTVIQNLQLSKIYEARKGLKKARALLHLLEPQLGALALEEKRRIREVARRFGTLRDADVSREVLEQFASRYKRKSTLDPQRKALREKHAILQQQTDSQPLLAESLELLAGTRKRIEDWHLHELTQESLNSEIRKTHKQGRQALKRALETKTPEDFHELRKSVKRELNQLRVFESAGSEVSSFKQLSSLLGDHHNLAVLTSTVENSSARFRQMVRRQQKTLEAQIMLLASRIYAAGLTSQ